MRKWLIYILFVTLCSTFCCAQGNDFFIRKSQECFKAEKYDSALYYINKVELHSPRQGKPERVDAKLAAAVHEQYCLIFSALDDKQQSDYHRNMYLDVKEHSRQDIHLERHAAELHKRMRLLMFKTVLLIIATIVFIIAFFYFRKLFTKDKEGSKILKKKDYREKNEELQEQIAVLSHQLRTEKRQGAEKRAKLSLLQSVSPLIARLRHALERIDDCTIDNLQYIIEILTEIQKHNALLADWIRMEQGKLSLKIETFSLRELQDILQKNAHSFALQGITLNVNLPDIKVKADKVLTLFMLNTLADNARKATPQGGTVTINASLETETESQRPVLDHTMVELSVSDTGKGMTEEQTANIFSHTITNGHGFGLLNCRGIINSYKKAGRLFNDCMIGAESTLGKGSRFFFRLPIAKLLLLLCTFNSALSPVTAQPVTSPLLHRAYAYADSAYYSNLDGNYEQAILYADSAQMCLMESYNADSILIDEITADISNEAAVAALALHRWEDYHTYNNIYENAFRRLTESDELVKYCREKEAYLQNVRYTWRVTNIFALSALLLLIVSLLVRYIHKRRMLRFQEKLDIEGKQSEIRRLTYETETLHIANNILTNGLSTIKHETMYYPARIKALLIDSPLGESPLRGDLEGSQSLELVTFYEQLYNNLLQQMTVQKLYPTLRPNDPELREYLDFLIGKYKGKRLNPDDAFTPKTENIPLLIARQIMRDFSARGTRGNGIIIDNDGNIQLRFG